MKGMKTVGFVAAMLGLSAMIGLSITGCDSRSDTVKTAAPPSATPRVPLAQKLDMQEQGEDARRNAQHLAPQEKPAAERTGNQ
jgi:hypothetical protein